MRVWCVFLVLSCAGCVRSSVVDASCGIPPGALALNEMLVNPQGVDTEQEWIELAHVQGSSYNLSGLVLEIETTSQKKRIPVVQDTVLEQGGYAVFDAKTWDFTLPNTQGTVRVLCAENVLDVFQYGDVFGKPLPAEGFSLARDGTQWCAQTPTQGAANALCEKPSECPFVEHVQQSAPEGGVVVSEILLDPDGKDAGQEWVEWYVSSDVPFYMKDMSMKQTLSSGVYRTWEVKSPACAVAYPGDILLFEVEDGATHTQDMYLQGPEFYNSASVVDVFTRETRVDSASLGDPLSGYSWSLKGDKPYVASSNDDPLSYCSSQKEVHTPGAANRPCGVLCQDETFAWRAWKGIQPEDILSVEIMADPDNPQADNDRDYIEIHTRVASVDLKGMWIKNTNSKGTQRSWLLGGDGCLSGGNDTVLLVGGKNTSCEQCRVHARFEGVSSTLLYNEPALLVIGAGDLEWIRISYPKPVPGASYVWDNTTHKGCVSTPSPGTADVRCFQ